MGKNGKNDDVFRSSTIQNDRPSVRFPILRRPSASAFCIGRSGSFLRFFSRCKACDFCIRKAILRLKMSEQNAETQLHIDQTQYSVGVAYREEMPRS